MLIGFYCDLVVGVVEGGLEIWCDCELYCLKVFVGVLLDILGLLGQNWGLLLMDLYIIVVCVYELFIDLLCVNMQNCGVLCIDYVMFVLCLWWILYGEIVDYGVYVQYLVDDLLLFLVLESQCYCCMVIGEDLGMVLVEIVSKLCNSGVYFYKVFYFESDVEKMFCVLVLYLE